MANFFAFLRSVFHHSVYLLTSSAAIAALTLWEHFHGAPIKSSLFMVVTIVLLVWACFRAWNDEHTKKRMLQASLRETEQNIRRSDTAQTVRRRAVKNQLALFLQEGQDIQRKWEWDNLNAPQEKQDWEKRVETYLKKEDESCAVRFRSPNRQSIAFPENMLPKHREQWADTTAKMAMLNDFISEAGASAR